MSGKVDLAGLRGLLPHRFPMLLVDRVDEVVPGVSLTARKAVSGNEPWYAQGQDPEYPRTLLIESWCQAAGVLATWDRPNPDVLSGQVMLFGGISEVRFLRPVRAGDLLEHRVRVERVIDDTLIFTGEALVDGRPVLTVGRATLALRPAELLRPAE